MASESVLTDTVDELAKEEKTLQEDGEEHEILEVVTAFADFQPTDDSQLCLQKGDKLAIICKENADWWWARKGERIGYVPTNHIARLSEDEDCWQDGEYFGSYSTMRLHLEMLQDKTRNLAYLSAIQQNQQHIQGKVVLDVGCGTGILSMFSVKHGKADRVYAVEASEFARSTQVLVDANGMSESIQVLQSKMEAVHLPQQVDLIISEWMGTFLLFEWMIESVILARDRWLKTDGVIWPSHATLYLVPCSAEELYRDKVEFWQSVHNLDFSSMVSQAKEEFFHRPLYNHVMKRDDALALPEEILHLDLKTVTNVDLEEILYNFSFTVSSAGTLHGFASWFQVDFAGFPSDNSKPHVSLNTGPDFPLTHWKQTLFVMDAPLQLEQGDSIEGAITIKRNKVWRRHLTVTLDYGVTSVKTKETQMFSKAFPMWRE